jgi:hypothetical protein
VVVNHHQGCGVAVACDDSGMTKLLTVKHRGRHFVIMGGTFTPDGRVRPP